MQELGAGRWGVRVQLRWAFSFGWKDFYFAGISFLTIGPVLVMITRPLTPKMRAEAIAILETAA